MKNPPLLLKPDFPFAPGKKRVFYGWYIVMASTVGMYATLPGQTMGVGPFTESLKEALQMSSSELSTAYLIGTLSSGLLLPHVGKWFDRVGARLMATIAHILFGLALLYLSHAQTFYEWFRPTQQERNFAAGFAIITLGYFLVRFLGQGTLTMVARAMLGKWFNRRRGLATSINGMFVSSGFALSPMILFNSIESLGWQETWALLGGLMMAVLLPFCWLYYRDNPEECGLLMDGKDPSPQDQPRDAAEFTIYREMTAPEARHTRAFWVFALGLGFLGYYGTALPYHGESIALEVGIAPEAFFGLFAHILPVQIASSFFIGWLSGRTRLKYCLVWMLFGITAATFGLILLPTTLGLVLYIGGSGAAWGGFGTLSTITFPRFFGRKHLGATSGMLMVTLVVSSALGPFAFSLSKDLTGSYTAAILSFTVMALSLLFIALGTENPQRRFAPQGNGPGR